MAWGGGWRTHEEDGHQAEGFEDAPEAEREQGEHCCGRVEVTIDEAAM